MYILQSTFGLNQGCPTEGRIYYRCVTSSPPGELELLSLVCSGIVFDGSQQCLKTSKEDTARVSFSPFECLLPSQDFSMG